MKYNSIGEQLIAKAKELDPSYKPDKFNDMSEAIDIILNNTGGGGKSVPPTLNLIDIDSETEGVRTSITQEEKDNLEKGLYNQVLYPDGTPFGYFMPSKMLGDKSLGINMFAQFYLDMNTGSITSFDVYSFSIGRKNTSGNYPITIEKQTNMPIGSGDGGNIWYNLNTTSGTITQNQYDEIKSLIDSNSLAGIKLGIYFPLVNSENNGTFTFGHYDLGFESTGDNTKYSMTKMEMIIKSDLSVSFSLKDIYVPILTQNLSSQSIPSIKTDGYQENLTIGDGLAIENGVLKTTGGGGSANSYPYITGRINASDTQTSSFPETDSETRVVTIENLDLSKLLSTRTIIVDADADASEVFNIACGAYGETEGIGTYVSSISCDKKTNNLFFFYINMDTQTNSFIIKRKTIPTSTTTITFEN